MSADAMGRLSRRSFIAGLAALATLPRIVRAQRGQRTIAWFGIGGPDDYLPYLNGLQNGLREAGWEESRNLRILRFASERGEHLERKASEEAAGKFGLAVSYFPITAVAQIEPAFAAIREAKCDALVVFPDAIMYRNRELISQLAAVARLPAVSGWSSFADSGLLFNYGPNLRDIYVRLASYVDRILRGAAPGSLPVEEPRSIELVVNLRTARALGIKISQSVLVRADRVIE